MLVGVHVSSVHSSHRISRAGDSRLVASCNAAHRFALSLRYLLAELTASLNASASTGLARHSAMTNGSFPRALKQFAQYLRLPGVPRHAIHLSL